VILHIVADVRLWCCTVVGQSWLQS